MDVRAGKPAGFAMVLAIALSLVCFLVVTAMVALARFELQATTGKAAGTQRYFTARGQVQELLQRLNSGTPVETFVGSPLLATVEGWEVETQAIPDPSGADGVFHVVASIDGERLAEATVHIAQPNGGGSFAGVLTGLPNFPTAWPHRFFQQTGEGAWTPIPSVPMECHDVSGNPIVASRVGWFYVADMLGHLVATTATYDGANRVGTGLHRYDPDLNAGAGGWESLGPIPRAVWLGADSWELSSTESEVTPLGYNPLVALGFSNADYLTNFNYLGVTRNGSEIYDRINYGNPTGLEGCIFRKLDVTSGAWSLIPGPRSSQYLPDGTLTQLERSGRVGFIAGANETGLVCISNNVVCRLTGSPPAWEYLPAVPRHYFDDEGNFHQDSGVFLNFGALAVGPHDEVYVGTNGPGEVMAISRYDPRQGWTSLRPPPDTPNWAVGGYLSVDGNGALLLESYHERDWWMRYDGEVWRKLPPLAFDPALGEGSHHAVGSRSLSGAKGRVVKRILR